MVIALRSCRTVLLCSLVVSSSTPVQLFAGLIVVFCVGKIACAAASLSCYLPCASTQLPGLTEHRTITHDLNEKRRES
jgi:hypothetical protein